MADKNDPTFEQIIEYAQQRWCWDDTAFLKEFYDKSFDPEQDTPQSFVDGLAEDYDLTDPRDYFSPG